MKITDRAVEAIKEILQLEADYIRRNDYVPLIGWCFNRKGIDEDPGPVIGVIEREKAHTMSRYETTAIVLYDNLPASMSQWFSDCELDLIENNLNFVRGGSIRRYSGQPGNVI